MEEIYEFNGGVGDILLVYEDRIQIKHKGVLNFLAMGIKGDKTIYYTDLTSVQFKKAGWTSGHIQFSLLGGRESVGGVLSASSDENTITFKGGLNEKAEEIVNYINKKIKEARTPKSTVAIQETSPADEILKYKQLLDSGIISQEDFEKKKKELLGI